MAVTEIGTKYTLTGPRGDVAVFNDPTDANYVGMLTEVTGLDSPDVRESADDLVQMDGGVHGDFFYGRRPITMTGLLLNPTAVTERNTRQGKLSAASDAMREDATLEWIPSGGVLSYLKLRRQQPLRVSGAWQKQFQLAMVAADPRIYGSVPHDTTIFPGAAGLGGLASPLVSPMVSDAAVSGQAIIANNGSSPSPPILVVTGPCSNPTLRNYTTSQDIVLTYTLAATENLVIDTLNRTVKLNNTADRYGAVDFLRTDWWWIEPGNNDVRFSSTSFSAGCSLEIVWRDAWL